jgi:DnaJ-class molecular chaperone
MVEPYFQECDACGSTGAYFRHLHGKQQTAVEEPKTCPYCGGVGAIATPAGDRILEMMRRWKARGQL